MDNLTNLQARLRELVDAKIERIAALKAEIVLIEGELDEAKAILGAWGKPAMPVPEEKRAPRIVKMRLQDVLAYLMSAGPQESRRILTHFGIEGRGAGVFGLWANKGQIVRHPDGRYAAPSALPVAVERVSYQPAAVGALDPLPRVAHPRFG